MWLPRDIFAASGCGKWEQWAIRTYGVNDNDQRLPEWLAAEPSSTVHEVIAAAESIDAEIESLSPALTEAILVTSLFGRRRPWVLDRSIHRREHLDAIEKALG